MVARWPNEQVTLNQSQLVYLLNLLIFVIVVAPERDWTERQLLNEHKRRWNHYNFSRNKVWDFLQRILMMQHVRVKQARTAFLLQECRNRIDVGLPIATHDLFTVLNDRLLEETYEAGPAMMRACIAMLADEFVRQPLNDLDPLLLTDFTAAELATAPEQPGPVS